MHKLALLVAATAVALFTACGSSGKCDGTSSCGTGGLDAGKDGSGGQGGGTFACKLTTCMRGTDACEVTTHLGQDAMGQCIALPAACSAAGADCTCFGDLMGCTCQEEPGGTFAVFCDV